MSNALKTFLKVAEYKRKARVADLAAKEMAKHCDARVRRMRKALALIDTFAWSMITLPPPAAKNLQRRVDACRKALADDLAGGRP